MQDIKQIKRGDVIIYAHHEEKYISQVVENQHDKRKLQVIPIFNITVDIELPYTTLLINYDTVKELNLLGNHPLPGDLVRDKYPEYLI